MASLGSINCPRCGGKIGLRSYGVDKGSDKYTAVMHIKLDPFDVRRHALCYQPPPDGKPLPEPLVA